MAKVARTVAEVSRERRDELERGDAASQTLVEILAIDFRPLLRQVATDLGVASRLPDDWEVGVAPGVGVVPRMASGGSALLSAAGPGVAERLRGHPSDTVRGWAAYALAAERPDLDSLLTRMQPFADDPHSGVREWAWMAARPTLLGDLERSIPALRPWVSDARPNVRRFAVEATRPRGVWCAHSARLKQEPALGLPLLEPLYREPHKYVQDSVANWLNDAAKTRADFVLALTAMWSAMSASPETQRIVRRARRSLGSGGPRH